MSGSRNSVHAAAVTEEEEEEEEEYDGEEEALNEDYSVDDFASDGGRDGRTKGSDYVDGDSAEHYSDDSQTSLASSPSDVVEDDGTSSQSDHLDELEGDDDGNSGTVLCGYKEYYKENDSLFPTWQILSFVDDDEGREDVARGIAEIEEERRKKERVKQVRQSPVSLLHFPVWSDVINRMGEMVESATLDKNFWKQRSTSDLDEWTENSNSADGVRRVRENNIVLLLSRGNTLEAMAQLRISLRFHQSRCETDYKQVANMYERFLYLGNHAAAMAMDRGELLYAWKIISLVKEEEASWPCGRGTLFRNHWDLVGFTLVIIASLYFRNKRVRQSIKILKDCIKLEDHAKRSLACSKIARINLGAACLQAGLSWEAVTRLKAALNMSESSLLDDISQASVSRELCGCLSQFKALQFNNYADISSDDVLEMTALLNLSYAYLKVGKIKSANKTLEEIQTHISTLNSPHSLPSSSARASLLHRFSNSLRWLSQQVDTTCMRNQLPAAAASRSSPAMHMWSSKMDDWAVKMRRFDPSSKLNSSTLLMSHLPRSYMRSRAPDACPALVLSHFHNPCAPACSP
ncbi:hypothetical protein GUITHDRAFT_132901 [Guillardia theta CCMP2712]|uniref:Uncharacterized protein n=1 Tax=Guillardia theta (strain CCMP2712) TaxID=905079 RepID=L1K003_GUITC|nr:hypothetical protein GUITHDRAFT_132901 [Guillardia theta CCMP2712]EKX53869.1 hypothetical protein GUITHDRAFT_132901 [Guillardia theta CCMP2712]|eukprot:XP_005840849.1 hypothetical protein GUITHDRAFT_132901 [Guillardia theta CCMP2712]